MEAVAVSVGKAALNGLLKGAKSAIAEESALTQAVQRDMVFLADELAEMQSTLRDAQEEQDFNKVPRSRVKPLRSLAYDVEDCLQEYSVHLEKPSGWRRARAVLERHRIAAEMKGLRARVEDMNQRNLHHQLIHSASQSNLMTGQSSLMTGETMSCMEEARREKDKAKVHLIRLINRMDENLRVIAIWGPSYGLQESIVKLAYHDLKRKEFECHSLIQIIHPFNPTLFLKNIIRQFYVDSLEETVTTTQQDSTQAQDLRRMGMITEDDLVGVFKKYLNEKRYLIVLTNLSSIEEWDQIKALFPSNNKGSRLIVCADQVEVASLCVEPHAALPDHIKLSSNQALYAFYEKGSQGGTSLLVEERRGLTRMETMVAAFKESQLIGREYEKREIINMISNYHSQEVEVISICGIGGIGKTTLVKHVYQSKELNSIFEKRAFVTVKRPFNPIELIGSLATQLGDKQDADGDKLYGHLQGRRYLIILDDVSSTTEWDSIAGYFPRTNTTSKIIVTTREENIAKHCSNILKLQLLGDQDVQNLFTEKVFGEMITNMDGMHPELIDAARSILKECCGLPLAIVTICGLLKFRPKTATEWRKLLHESIRAESVINSNFSTLSYDALPYHMKPCFLYLSIFPEDHKIRRRRLVRRWTAEGYSREIQDRLLSAEEVADKYFMELIDRNMILPSQEATYNLKGIDSCQVHDLIREIGITKSGEENFVFRLEEGYSSNNQGKVRHLAISSNWSGNKTKFENAVNVSRIRSLTVFGKWRHFFISDKMRLLRVLDLEETTGLVDHHLKYIGKFLHLKFLSLRGCRRIYHLPDSVGNLVHIQTLDVKNTRIIKFPKAIIRLRKLEYLRAGNNGVPILLFNTGPAERLGVLTLSSVGFCVACWAPQLMKQSGWIDGDMNRSDVCTACCCNVLPGVARDLDPCGVVMPIGADKLTVLRTLGNVNIVRGKSIIQGIGSLTQLKKLGVVGVNRKNSGELCSALANLVNLESLLVQSRGMPGLQCLKDLPSTSDKIQSLKLYGTLVRLPEWIGGLQNLVKLVLRMTELTEVDGTMQLLGKLPNLAILRLVSPFNYGEACLTFRREAFPSLMVLHIKDIYNHGSVEFEEAGATPRLELLVLDHALNKTSSISGLSSLPSLKEVVIKPGISSREEEELIGGVRDQVSRNPNNPVFKREWW